LQRTNNINNDSLLSALIAAVLLFSSCCTKKECYDTVGFGFIVFHDFAEGELDSVMLYRYAKESGFTNLLDSVELDVIPNFGYSKADLDMLLIPTSNYEVVCYTINNSYKIENIRLEKKHCNSCFPYKIKDDSFMSILGYTVNGQWINSSQLRINR
jgi:hypothetical protein